MAKAAIDDPSIKIFKLTDQKTMYGGKHVAPGDTIYLFASENEGGTGLFAKGEVESAAATPRPAGAARHTPRISVRVRRTAFSKSALGRKQLKPYSNWEDGRPETELNFKFYRQATNKIAGISEEAAALLDTHFP